MGEAGKEGAVEQEHEGLHRETHLVQMRGTLVHRVVVEMVVVVVVRMRQEVVVLHEAPQMTVCEDSSEGHLHELSLLAAPCGFLPPYSHT